MKWVWGLYISFVRFFLKYFLSRHRNCSKVIAKKLNLVTKLTHETNFTRFLSKRHLKEIFRESSRHQIFSVFYRQRHSRIEFFVFFAAASSFICSKFSARARYNQEGETFISFCSGTSAIKVKARISHFLRLIKFQSLSLMISPILQPYIS